MFDEKIRFHKTGLDFARPMEIKEWALEQAKILLRHQWNDDTKRALMEDRRYTRKWNKAEQTHLLEYDE